MALRHCSGALQDLAEGSGATPFRPGGPAESGSKDPEIGAWPVEAGKKPEEENPVKKTEDKAKKAEKVAKRKEKRGKRKDKKKDTKSPTPEKPRASSGTKKEEEESGREDPERSESPEERPEIRRKRKAEPYRKDKERPVTVSDQDLQEDGSKYGLSRIAVRGSVSRVVPDIPRVRSHDRPPEPAGPPPRKGKTEYEEYQEYLAAKRESQGGDLRREKGFKHWRRGREHWRGTPQRK